ncbi:MAG: TetR/AcrR family transcriptional regulator [Planctomycetota bacterium]
MAGRPRNFDEADALGRVVDTFRRHGYDATTFAQLVASTGLSRSSLYNAFGDKDALFEKALTAYLRDEVDPVLAGFDSGGADALGAFVDSLAEPFDPASPPGLYLRTLLENAATPDRARHVGLLGRTLNTYWERLTGVFGAKAEKTLNRSPSAGDRDAAAMLIAVLLGAAVIARNGKNEALLAAVSRSARAAFG